ncbi:MAG: exodeoxyribonuclease V subunit gamma [Magnetococcales bacterium]|nr:exodeoxyribonuclease V subunit gamma [Magnetococcales bacterium]
MSQESRGMLLVHGNRPERLRDDLTERMRADPLPPLANEIILVQSNGMAQWLRLGIAEAGGGGIAAALEMLLPARFLWRVYRGVLGVAGAPDQSPFDKARLSWRLMRMLPALLPHEPYRPLRRFLEQDADLRKRWQLAERLSDLFDQYQVYRADWLDAWARGEDHLIDARGGGEPLPEEQRWQPALWRALLADVERTTMGHHAGRAEVHAAFLRHAGRLGDERRPPGLPRRVTVFGITSLPRQSLEVLLVLSRWTRVVMYIHNPCQYYWADIVPERELLRAGRAGAKARPGFPDVVAGELLHLHAQPLLAAWGRQGRDFIGLLDELASDGFDLVERAERFELAGEEAATLLQQLQDDIHELRPLHETREAWPAVDPSRDRSLRFHVAHGALREVEILHDQLLAALNADATLTPREILVMVPDIEEYAAHIQAVFGLHHPADERRIPFVIVNRARRGADPLLRAVERLLALPGSRLTASELIDWLELPALRRKFAIVAEDLPLLHRWIRGSGIRWGLHGEHRAALGLPGAIHGEESRNTWRFGLRRMLLGYAVGDRGHPWRGIDPYDEIDAGCVRPLGALIRLIDALEETWRCFSLPAPVGEWCQRLRTLLDTFFLPDDGEEGYTLLQLEAALEPWREACEEAGLSEPLPLSVVGETWLASIDEGGLSQGFFAGAVTFATLMPMRAIPFRQVCLLGMNDGAFPRPTTPMDFDLMARNRRPGDRSRREDDRYLFLEALLSARELLYVSWVGRSIHDNSVAPPSVLVGRLREHLAAGWRLAGGGDLLGALTVEHRLQPFSRDYFATPAQPDSPFFTYAREWRPGGPECVTSHNRPLPPVTREEPLTLLDLARFLKDPVRAFYQERLGVFFESGDPFAGDQEPFAPDALERWRLLDELIRCQGRALEQGEAVGAARAAALERIRLRGDLAEGGCGRVFADHLAAPLEELAARQAEGLTRWPLPGAGEVEVVLRVEVEPGAWIGLEDRVANPRIAASGEAGRVMAMAGTLVDKAGCHYHRAIVAWVEHLALNLAHGAVTTLLLGAKGGIELRPLHRELAEKHLAALLQAWWSGMQRPLPLAPETGLTWLTAGEQKARSTYEGTGEEPARGGEGERMRGPHLPLVYPDFTALTESGEFATLADRLLRPLLKSGEALP